MRENYLLYNTSPKGSFYITWQPQTLTIENTSKFPVYIGIGRDTVSTGDFDDLLAPNSLYNADPAGATDFAVLIDNSTDPATAFKFPVNVIFSSGGGVGQNPLSLS